MIDIGIHSFCRQTKRSIDALFAHQRAKTIVNFRHYLADIAVFEVHSKTVALGLSKIKELVNKIIETTCILVHDVQIFLYIFILHLLSLQDILKRPLN